MKRNDQQPGPPKDHFTCGHCWQWKPATAFSFWRYTRGWRAICGSCGVKADDNKRNAA